MVLTNAQPTFALSKLAPGLKIIFANDEYITLPIVICFSVWSYKANIYWDNVVQFIIIFPPVVTIGLEDNGYGTGGSTVFKYTANGEVAVVPVFI